MPASAPSIDHATLGCTILGQDCGRTVQYRGLKYASIPGRWKQSILLERLPTANGGVYDARCWGPSCPQKKDSWRFDMALVTSEVLPMGQDQGDDLKMDELECCHVVVTVPKGVDWSTVDGDGGSPVLVLVHGGALSWGGNSWVQYDMERLIARSVEIGKPVIGVTINYRIGILGFLASSEAGIRGNFGLGDQMLAFKWIQQHIAGFGGNANNVTALGESAGAISISTLLFASKAPLFNRAITMAGEATLRKPRRMSWHNHMYVDQLKMLGIDHLSREERIAALRRMPVEAFAEKLPVAQHYCAVVDGEFLEDDVTMGVLADPKSKRGKPDWCKELVVSDCLHDGTVLKGRTVDDPQALRRLEATADEHLTSAEKALLFQTYNLPTSFVPLSPAQEASLRASLLQLTSDLRFYLPTLAVSSAWNAHTASPRTCHRFHFHHPNPCRGNYRNLASHELDLALLLQNFDELLPPASRAVAREMADLVIGFASGGGWRDGVVVVGKERLEVLRNSDEYDRRFREGRGEVLRGIGYERCFWLAEGFAGVRPESGMQRL